MDRIIQIGFLLIILLAMGCAKTDTQNVGDIPFEESLDDPHFQLCNEDNIKQYYVRRSSDSAPEYAGEKRALEKVFYDHYSYPESVEANGYLTIRFIVNCEGQTGRFRVEEMDFDYQPTEFDDQIANQLIEIIKKLEDWTPRESKGVKLDFYQYLNFKLINGQIRQILP